MFSFALAFLVVLIIDTALYMLVAASCVMLERRASLIFSTIPEQYSTLRICVMLVGLVVSFEVYHMAKKPRAYLQHKAVVYLAGKLP